MPISNQSMFTLLHYKIHYHRSIYERNMQQAVKQLTEFYLKTKQNTKNTYVVLYGGFPVEFNNLE